MQILASDNLEQRLVLRKKVFVGPRCFYILISNYILHFK